MKYRTVLITKFSTLPLLQHNVLCLYSYKIYHHHAPTISYFTRKHYIVIATPNIKHDITRDITVKVLDSTLKWTFSKMHNPLGKGNSHIFKGIIRSALRPHNSLWVFSSIHIHALRAMCLKFSYKKH